MLAILMTSKLSLAQSGPPEIAAEESWDSYTGVYEEGKPGTTLLRMDLIEHAPIIEFPYLVITALSYKTSRQDGLPEAKHFPIFKAIEDSTISFLKRESDFIWTGSFTWNTERLQYAYLRDGNQIKPKLESYLKKHFPAEETEVVLRFDGDWDLYRTFLYPNPQMRTYLSNASIVNNLRKAGDKLTKARKVRYDLTFRTEKDLQAFLVKAKEMGFQVEGSSEDGLPDMPWNLTLSRIDQVDLESIHGITVRLSELAAQFKGSYGGWETQAVLE